MMDIILLVETKVSMQHYFRINPDLMDLNHNYIIFKGKR